MLFLISNFLEKTRIVLLIFSIILFSLGQLGRIQIAGIDGVYLYEISLALFLIFSLNKIKFSKIKSSLNYSGIFFISSLGISLVSSLGRYPQLFSFEATLYFLRLAFYVILIAFSSFLLKNIHKNTGLKIALLTSFIFIILSSIVQILFFPKVGVLSYLGWDPHMYRVIGLFFDPPIAVSFYVIFFIIIIFLKMHHLKLKFALLALCLLLALFTYSRGGYLGLLVTVATYFIFLKKIRLILLFSVIFLIFLTFISSSRLESVNLLRTSSVNSRILSLSEGFSMFKEKPIVGIGYNQIKSERFSKDSVKFIKNKDSNGLSGFHSSFLIILVTGGAVGLILFIFFLFNIAKLSKIHFYSILYLSVISLFDNVLLHPFILFLVFLVGLIKEVYVKNPKKQ